MGRLVDVKRYAAGLRSKRLTGELNDIVKDMNKQTTELIKELDRLPKAYTKRRRKSAMRKAGKVFVETCQSFVKDSKESHFRYKNGEPIEYVSGNLRRSIQVLNLRKAVNSVYVGAKITRKSLSKYGDSDKTTQPYYAHMVEYGTKHSAPQGFMRKGFSAGKGQAIIVLTSEIKKIFKRYEKSIKKKTKR
jgi:HK97 gp10 family phage protein